MIKEVYLNGIRLSYGAEFGDYGLAIYMYSDKWTGMEKQMAFIRTASMGWVKSGGNKCQCELVESLCLMNSVLLCLLLKKDSGWSIASSVRSTYKDT